MISVQPSFSSLPVLHSNPDWSSLPLFDRKGWKRVRFGDVVQNCNETFDPLEAGLERFIAMEHLEPGGCMCDLGEAWQMEQRSHDGVGQSKCCLGNVEPISGKWPWRSSTR